MQVKHWDEFLDLKLNIWEKKKKNELAKIQRRFWNQIYIQGTWNLLLTGVIIAAEE